MCDCLPDQVQQACAKMGEAQLAAAIMQGWQSFRNSEAAIIPPVATRTAGVAMLSSLIILPAPVLESWGVAGSRSVHSPMHKCQRVTAAV